MGPASRILRLLPIAGLSLGAGCDPNIGNLDPATGHDRALVRISGPAIGPGGAVFWNAGSTAEEWRPSGLLGLMLSVPDGATPGTYPVQREVGGRRGNAPSFTVDDDRPFPDPRVDRVSLDASFFTNATTVQTLLYVQGTNVDVGSVVEIRDNTAGAPWRAIPTAPSRALLGGHWEQSYRIDWKGFAYPIYHSIAFLALPGELPVGTRFEVRIRNEYNIASDAVWYTLPASAAETDSDGDDIPDAAETAQGTNPLRPDILIELDYMSDGANPLEHPWSADVATALQASFGAAPILNPLGPDGINVVVDAQPIPRRDFVYYNLDEDQTIAGGSCTNAAIPEKPSLLTLKRLCFNNGSRGRFWHYCVWASRAILTSSSGSEAEKGGFGEIGGDDCLVAADLYTAAWMDDPRTGAEVLMHEVGHNLGQRHGGATDEAYSLVYNSVMNPRWLGRNHWGPLSRQAFPVCAPLYYRLNGAADGNGSLPTGTDPNLVQGFSDGMGRPIRENDLDEQAATPGAPFGVCDLPVDLDCVYTGGSPLWTCNSTTTGIDLTRDINLDGDTTDEFKDYPNWASLVFTGPRTNGSCTLVSDAGGLGKCD